MTRLILCLLLIGLTTHSVSAQSTDEAQPVDAIEAILAAYDQYPLVAIGDVHGVKELGDFYAALVQHPQFAAKVNVIVVEFGSALHQDIMDRYVAGEDVPHEELSRVWRDVVGAGPGALDAPMYEQFFAAVRAVNQALPEGQKLRVLLGDPPLDWTQVQRIEDVLPAMTERDQHFADVVITEVLEKGLKALVITGSTHLARGEPDGGLGIPVVANPLSDRPSRSAMMQQIVEEKYPNQTFIVQLHTGYIDPTCNADVETRLASWSLSTLAVVKNTWLEGIKCAPFPANVIVQGDMPGIQALGGADFVNPQAPPDTAAMIVLPGGQSIQADAYLFLGTKESLTMSRPDPAIYDDEAYFQELSRRQQIMTGRPLDRAVLVESLRPGRFVDAFPGS